MNRLARYPSWTLPREHGLKARKLTEELLRFFFCLMTRILFARWDAPVLRTYLVTSKTHQIVELVIGILWTLFSIAAVLFNRKYMKRAFKID